MTTWGRVQSVFSTDSPALDALAGRLLEGQRLAVALGLLDDDHLQGDV